MTVMEAVADWVSDVVQLCYLNHVSGRFDGCTVRLVHIVRGSQMYPGIRSDAMCNRAAVKRDFLLCRSSKIHSPAVFFRRRESQHWTCFIAWIKRTCARWFTKPLMNTTDKAYNHLQVL